jgi:hypothetical protein
MSPADAENHRVCGLPLFFRELDGADVIRLFDGPDYVFINSLQPFLQRDGDIGFAADGHVDGLAIKALEPGREGELRYRLLDAGGVETFVEGIFLGCHFSPYT